MARWKRAAGYTVLALGVILIAGITATIGWRPFIGPRARALTARTFAVTPERLERGRYLATSGIAPCVGCHSEMVVSADGALSVPEATRFAGRNWTPDGVPFVTAPNLTPDPETGIGSWSDDTVARAVREGISHDGRALFPIMPYEKFRTMTDEDLASIVVFLRSLPPVKRNLPPTAVPFPLNRIINAVPQPLTEPVTADLSTPEKRGRYLVTIGACADCHTPRDDRGGSVPNMDFAGGNPAVFGAMKQDAAANLTPSPNGIPYYTEALFIEALRTGRVRERKLNDQMPTTFYRHMTDDDMRSIFAYLKTLTPIDHYVDNAMTPTPCPRCGLTHGGGERNQKQ